MRYLILILLSINTLTLNAQFFRKYKKTKVSYNQGTYFGYLGINRAYYTKANLRFTGPLYNITYKEALIHDNPAPFTKNNYLGKHPLISPQFSWKIGYYVKNNFAVSLGYDRFKYYLRNRSRVFLVGVVDPTADSKNYGKFDGAEHIVDTAVINYQNSMNYYHLDFSWTTPWYKKKSGSKLGFSSDFGIGAGPIISKNSFLFGGEKDTLTKSLSGGGISIYVGNRLELKDRIFFQLNLSSGLLFQTHVRTRNENAFSYSTQNIGYASLSFSIGLFLYGRTINGCDTCPEW